MMAQELKNSAEADDQGCSEDYYHLLLSRVDETLEETKREKTKRRREVDVQHGGSDDSYRVELYVAGASPLQVMTYMIDPDNRRYLSPSVVSVVTERDERDGQGVEHLELSLRVRQILCCCIPVTRTMRVKYCIEKDKERLVCHEEAGMVEKSQHYTFEEDSGGTHVICVVQHKRPRWSVGCSSPISESEHVLLLQRLKAIMELDDPLLVLNGTDATSSLLYTDL